MKKRKIRYDRLFILLAMAVAIIVVIFFGIKFLFFNHDEVKEDPKPDNNPTASVSEVTMTLDDYKVYADPALDFRFVIADFTFKTTEGHAIAYDLSKLETNELIQLNAVEAYLVKVQEAGYSRSKMALNSEIKSNDATFKAKLFIPVTKAGDSISLINLISSEQFQIDLTQNKGDISEFINTSGEVISDGKTYDIYVSDAYVNSTMYHGDEQYTYPSTVKIYTFKLTVNDLKGEERVMIEEAYFVPDGSSEKIKALDATFSSMKDDNILNKPLNVNDTYALFFEMFNPDESGIKYDGKLQLKFANSNELVEISTVLQ